MTTWGRTLTRNDDVTIPGTVICVAVATDVEPDALNPRRRIHRLRCGHAIAGRLENGKWTRMKSEKFTLACGFWKWTNFVRQSKKPVWILACDLSRTLRLLGFCGLLESSEFSLQKAARPIPATIRPGRLRERLSRSIPGLLIEGEPPTAVVCWHRDGWKMTMIGVENYWDKTISQLSLLSSTPGAPPTAIPNRESEPELWCQRTAEVTRECVIRLCGWHKSQGMGKFGLTVSSMALSGFRHRWLQHDIECPPSQADRDFERRAYYGGRTEALWIGEVRSGLYHPPGGLPMGHQFFSECPQGPFHLIDARSFYGAIQQFQALPFRCVDEGIGWPDGDENLPPLDGDYLAEVGINSPSETYPIRSDWGVAQASGRFVTVLCGPELQRALRDGHVTTVGRWRRFETDLIFRGYAVGLWMEREAAESRCDGLTSALIKALLARLHGKFLQREHEWEVLPGELAPGPWERWQRINADTRKMTTYRSIGWTVQRERERGDKPHCFPAIAAWVAATGREWLRSWMKIAGYRHVFYCSTDSLIVDDHGRKALESAGIVGDYGIGSCRVVETSNRLTIHGVNHFEIGGKRVHAGFPADCRIDHAGLVRYHTSATLASTLFSPPPDTIAENEVTTRGDAKRELSRWTPGGWLKPITLQEGDDSWKIIDSASRT